MAVVIVVVVVVTVAVLGEEATSNADWNGDDAGPLVDMLHVFGICVYLHIYVYVSVYDMCDMCMYACM